MGTSSLISARHAAASISLAMAHPASSTAASSSSSSSDDSATITANDFLTLLVTEMQNQDPTADTDPNEYVNQLINVNSLQQLIQINQTLTSDVPAPTSGAVPAPGNGSSPNAVNGTGGAGSHAPSSPAAASTHPSSASLSAEASALSGTPAPVTAPVTSGNLDTPSSSPAALRVASAFGSSRPRR